MGLPDGVVIDHHSLFNPLLDGVFDPLRPRTIIKILVVVDGRLDLAESQRGFGPARVVRLLRESKETCNRFEVDTARRETKAQADTLGAAGAPTIYGFRFDQLRTSPTSPPESILNKYDEVWCFGFNPANLPMGTDADITTPAALPLTPNELFALTEWMNLRQGGLLAMGDHDILGASMCHKIPRIRSMRRWTKAEGAPPFGMAGFPGDSHLRHDTMQPVTPGEMAGTEAIPERAEEDWKPQPLEVVSWNAHFPNLSQALSRPHPILCHPTLGVINAFPDHPHEGWPYDNNEIVLSSQLGVAGMAGDEYPTVNGIQPRPTVIAYGRTTPDPPFILPKGPSQSKRYPMVSVYDGHEVGVGRVVTDATWHHWFDMNLTEIEAVGGTNWKKISRYYTNVALWLAPGGSVRTCWGFDIIASHFWYPAIEEYSLDASLISLGQSLRSTISRYWGPCWMAASVYEAIRTVDEPLWTWLQDHLAWKDGFRTPHSGKCFSCPPFDMIETIVLGGMVRSSFKLVELITKRPRGRKAEPVVKVADIDAFIREGASIGLKECRSLLKRSKDEIESLL